MHLQRILIMSCSGVGYLSLFLPWAKVQVFIANKSFNAFEVQDNGIIGFILLVTFAIPLIFTFIGDKTKPILRKMNKFVIIGASLSFGVTSLIALAYNVYDGAPLTTIQIGLYLSLLSSLMLVLIPFIITDKGKVHIPSADELVEEIEEYKDEIQEGFKS